MGTVSDWHKKQRKKELKKNKETRLAARNERVLTEKSIPGIQKEIAALEAAVANQQNHSTQMKLDRLKKELKLLQKTKESTKQTSSVKPVRTAVQYEPLPDPRVSIYYDADMNPFGEPPPGRPRLFHRRGGGTTLTLREACVPGEEDEVPRSDKNVERSTSASKLPQQQPQNATENQKQPKHNLKKTTVTRSETQAPALKSKATKHSAAKPISTEPKQVPELPQASAAVKRSKKLAVDIWASTSELEYAESWEYRDLTAHQIQGPFGTDQMRTWIRAGHFPAHTSVRRVNTNDWKPLSEVKELWRSNKKRKTKDEPNEVQKRIAALRNRSSDTSIASNSIEGRIAALRGSAPPQHDAQEDTQNDAQSRIAALRGDPQDTVKEHFEQRDEEGDPSIALASEVPNAPSHSNHEVTTTGVDEVQTDAPSIIANNPLPPSPLPRPQLQDEMHEVPSYPLSASPSMPLPSPPPGPNMPLTPPPSAYMAGNDAEEIPSYPITLPSNFHSDMIPAYPLPLASDDENPDVIAPYPIPPQPDDEGVVAPYPIPPQPDDEDVVAAYPMPPPVQEEMVKPASLPEDAVEQTKASENANPRRGLKKANLDKSLVAFLPTTLQRKRPQASK